MPDEIAQPSSRVVGTLVWLAIVLTLLFGFWHSVLHLSRLQRELEIEALNQQALTICEYSLANAVPYEVMQFLIPVSYLVMTAVIVFCRHVPEHQRLKVLLPQLLTVGLTFVTCVIVCMILLANQKLAEARAMIPRELW